MLRLLVLLILICVPLCQLNAQSWAPLSITSLNLYEDTSASFPRYPKLFSFSDQLLENDVAYMWGHLRSGGGDCDTAVSCDSQYWTCHKLTHPWFGSQVIADGSSVRIRSASFDTLYFDFNSSVGDTLWILDDSVKIYGVCTVDQTESLMGYDDDVHHFTLGHTDVSGIPIPFSSIHGENFRLGRDLGFIDYFYLSENGVASKILTMIGNRQLDAGKHSFKYSDCFVFPVGSSYQIKKTSYFGFGGPSAIDIEYIKSDITSVVDNGGSYAITRDIYTLATDGLGTDTSEITETGVVDNRGKYELITSYFDDVGGYFEKSLSRSIHCGDTIFNISYWGGLVDTVCYADSMITYYEIDPLGSTYSRNYRQFHSSLDGWTPNQAQTSINISQQLVYLNTPNCLIGYPWHLGVEELEEEQKLVFHRLSNNLYQFDETYDSVQVFSLDGKEAFDQGSFTFHLKKSTVYIVRFTLGGKVFNQKVVVSE